MEPITARTDKEYTRLSSQERKRRRELKRQFTILSRVKSKLDQVVVIDLDLLLKCPDGPDCTVRTVHQMVINRMEDLNAQITAPWPIRRR